MQLFSAGYYVKQGCLLCTFDNKIIEKHKNQVEMFYFVKFFKKGTLIWFNNNMIITVNVCNYVVVNFNLIKLFRCSCIKNIRKMLDLMSKVCVK